MRKFHKDGTIPTNGEIFVFGSNLAGRHGKGSALVARQKFGAIYGQGRGPMGQSYAIPTKDGRPGTPYLTDPRSTRSLAAIKVDVQEFIEYATKHPELQFFVVRLGCALATHSNADIAPMFAGAPANCSFSEEWAPWLQTPEPSLSM